MVPCGACVALFNRDGDWVAASMGEPSSDHWLNFVKRALDGYGVDLSDLDPKVVYTLICTDKTRSPASQDAVYMVNEFGGRRERKAVGIPRPEYIPLATEKLFKYGVQWQVNRIEALIRNLSNKAFNFVAPVFAVDVRFGNYSWRILTEAGRA